MRVFVAGASGAIGRRLVPWLSPVTKTVPPAPTATAWAESYLPGSGLSYRSAQSWPSSVWRSGPEWSSGSRRSWPNRRFGGHDRASVDSSELRTVILRRDATGGRP